MEKFSAVVNNIQSTASSKRVREEENNQPGTIIDRQPFSKALLLSTTYSLNASCSKMVTIGLGLTAGQNFDVVINLTGRYTNGITLSNAEWEALCAHKTNIASWFDEQQTDEHNIHPNIHWTGRHKINFTTAYNEKAIVLTLKESEDIAQMKKAKKAFSSDVVMQKKTFDGLLTIIPCINNKIKLLREDLELVNRVKDFLVERISVETTMADPMELQKGQVNTASLKMLQEEYMDDVWERVSIRNFYTPRNDVEIDNKRHLIGSELICLHHEYIFRKVMENIKKT